ncbi:zinc finger protein [Theobroma cacao]|nr:zinc finger protein [Theobroma cacao]WRX10269.1 zinc finger protein [Theobroma cacao]
MCFKEYYLCFRSIFPPPFPQPQQRPLRFSGFVITIPTKSFGGSNRRRNCGKYHVGMCREHVQCFHCGQPGHIRSTCPLFGQATIATLSPPAHTDMQRRDSSGLPPRQRVAILSGVESNALAHPPSRP